MSAGIVEGQYLAIRMPFLAHDLGSHLAKPDSVTRTAAVKNDLIAAIADVVPVALQALPSDVTPYRRTKQSVQKR